MTENVGFEVSRNSEPFDPTLERKDYTKDLFSTV